MSITIPTTYSLEDLTVGEGIASGQLITASGLSTIADNHNFIGANYRPPVAEVFDVDGFGHLPTTGFNNFTGTPVLEETDGRGMTFIGVFTNTNSSNPSSVRLACGSNNGSAVSLAAGATAQTVTLTCDTPSSGNFVATVQVSDPTTNNSTILHAGSFFWTGKTGSQSSNPTSGGFRS